MSTPTFAALWISGCADHLLSEQIDQQQGCVAFRAVTTQAESPGKQIARRAAPLADQSFQATRALVDRLCDHRAALAELLAKALQVGPAGLVVAEAERPLLVGP